MSKLTLKLLLPLLLCILALAYAFFPVVNRITADWFKKDLDIRAELVANTMHDGIAAALKSGHSRSLVATFQRVLKDERLSGLVVCRPDGNLLAQSQNLPQDLNCSRFVRSEMPSARIMQSGGVDYHVYVTRVQQASAELGYLLLMHDMGFILRRSDQAKQYMFFLFIGLGLLVSLLSITIVHFAWKGWMSRIIGLFRRNLFSSGLEGKNFGDLQPVVKELKALIRDIEVERSHLELNGLRWTANTIKEALGKELYGEEIIVVANREPYIHTEKDGEIIVQNPASGLVTALEPVMRACSGTWIAHGSGNADRRMVDARDSVRVPPENPTYKLRRVWLSEEEENGYYYGFSNEGLWPLCHIAHTRPVFRSEDWEQYLRVNRKFADVVVEEATSTEPVVLVQDYHFALLPQMIKERLPRATVIMFWHIPWPNPESFGICPWREQLLEGLLGSTILGFHTRFHCNNFLESVDRYLESRIDRETNTIAHSGDMTAVRNYPISIEWPSKHAGSPESFGLARRSLRERFALPEGVRLGVGVDRLDYTKGILERFSAVERLLEIYPQWVGQFVFIQIAAPSRSKINRYGELDAQVSLEAERINQKFAHAATPPIILLKQHHGAAEIAEYFRAADLCFVSSLHDGMNLVAKEFVAARGDEQGVLILSSFTGAARELLEAIVVNPYSFDECARALHMALMMGPVEQRQRMRTMRQFVKENNVYRWAGRMLLDAAHLRRRSRILSKARGAGVNTQTGLQL